MTTGALTDTDRWDSYWQQVHLPVEVERDQRSSTDAILDVIDRFAASPTPRSVLEVGGAPGGFLIHLWRRFHHHVCVLDSSPTGVAMTARNFELLGVPGDVIEGDLFSGRGAGEQYDLVYSLGLIEHFDDTTSVIAAHLDYLRPGGTLIVGCPNFRGLNLALLRSLSPSMLAWHNLEAMDVSGWRAFERELSLEVKFRGYVGGFQPGAFWRCERRATPARALARALTEVGNRMDGRAAGLLAGLNSRHWSYYSIAAYEKLA